MSDQKKLSCEIGVLSRTDGSALLCQRNTAILVGVYGPIEIKQQKLLIDKAAVEVYYRPKAGLPSVGDRLYESIIRNTCETMLLSNIYPRSAITINIQEMESGGGELIACAINATTLALLDSRIDLKFMVAAASCVLDQNGDLLVEMPPSHLEEPKAVFVFAFDSVEKRIIVSHTTGSFSSEVYESALDLCKTQCEDVFRFFKSTFSTSK